MRLYFIARGTGSVADGVRFWNAMKKTGFCRNFVNYAAVPASIHCGRMTEPDRRVLSVERGAQNGAVEVRAAWREFIRFCGQMRHGEIERLSIQDAVPVLAEITKKKVKFS